MRCGRSLSALIFCAQAHGFKGLFAFWSYFCAQASGFYGRSSVLCTGAWVLIVFLRFGATFVYRRMGLKGVLVFRS